MFAVALGRAAVHERAKVHVEWLPAGRVESWQPVLRLALDQHLLELGQQRDALGDHECVVAGARKVDEHATHLSRALQVEVLGVEPESLRVRLELLLLDAQQHVVRLRVVGPRVMEVVRGHDVGADLPRHLYLHGQDLPLVAEPMVLQLDEVPVCAEDVAVLPRRGDGAVSLPRDELHTELGGQAARQADDPLRMLGQELLVDAGPVVEPLEVRGRHETQQVPVPDLVLREQREVVVLLLALARRPVESGAGGHVGLDPDDRLDPGRPGRRIEAQRAEHRAVVGHGERRHPVGERFAEDRGRARVGLRRFDPRGAVQQRVLGVCVQMDELLSQPWSDLPSRLSTALRGGCGELTRV
jgi:hypothetical protein